MQIAGMTGERKMVRPATRPHNLHLKVAFLSKQVSLTQLLQLIIREIDVFVNRALPALSNWHKGWGEAPSKVHYPQTLSYP